MNGSPWVSAVTIGDNAITDQPVPVERRLVQLISDDPLMVRALTRLLVNAGYDVIQSDSVQGNYPGEILRGETSRCPALVIVDVPDDWYRRVTNRSDRQLARVDGPRVLWIGDAVAAVRRSESHLPKPFSGSELLSKVAALLAS